MRRREWIACASALAIGFAAAGASAKGEAPAASAKAAASAAPARSAAPAASALPPGHPQTGDGFGPGDDDDSQPLPPGHPPTSGGGRASPAGMPNLPENSSELDRTLPAGTIVVEVRDGDDKPVPNVDVSLGIMSQSVSKGESRRHLSAKADASGVVRFDGLEVGQGNAYRATVPWSKGAGGAESPVLATYGAMPFQLDLKVGERARVHVFPVSPKVEDSLIGIQGIAYFEIKDEVLQVEEMLTVFNLGKTTWVPADVVFDLPAGFKAFNAQKTMSDVGVDQVEGRGARLRGTISPGQHEIEFRYQVPYSGGENVDVTMGLPPRVAAMRIMSEAPRGMTLRVADFPAAVPERNQQGQRILFTEKQQRQGEAPMKTVRLTLENLPGPGTGRWWAVAIAAVAAAAGIATAYDRSKSQEREDEVKLDAQRARERLVAELANLERDRADGSVGPKTYERARQILIDALARVMAIADR